MKIISKFSNWFRTLQARSGLAILVTAAVLIEVTGAVQYWFAAKGIREEAQHRAEAELQQNSQHIQGVMTAVEVAVANSIWVIEASLSQPDSIYTILRHIVEQNSTIVGCGAAFIADYYPERGRWFEPYVAERDDGRIEISQIGSASHDYLNANWYKKGMEAGRGYWSEPYYDEAGARMMLCTYSMPIRDAEGRAVALIGADVSLDWLGSVINAHPIYPSSYNLMISREGQIMACPVESLIMRRSIYEVTAGLEDTAVNRINQQMLEGKSGHTTIRENDGTKNYVFFAPVEGKTGWSMAVVCSDDEIYRSLRTVGFNLLVLMILGLALMAYIILRTIRGFNSLQTVNAEKERMGSELRIANAIQMGMLPKTFPPFPDRDDVELFGSLVPAKEVGGDLYDFFIRDEKLFFCVGDVSGKGVPASLVMAVTRSLFRSVSVREANPGRIIESMNTSMSEMNDSNMFVTLFVGVLDLPTGRLHYCNAGHCAPLLVGNGVGPLPMDSNIPVGIMGDWKFTSQEAVVSPGTIIFLYTDGLTEAENAQHEQFGEARMFSVMRQGNYHTLIDLINRMTEAVVQFVSGALQSDDLTMLA
ncbi:MAG: SpoIIE family protein phosphatase, partial [Bacteroidaceae bacterium]|nr:SpoIIE family protein phosphatase [Bacteroidaceae bacterium]